MGSWVCADFEDHSAICNLPTGYTAGRSQKLNKFLVSACEKLTVMMYTVPVI